MPASTCSLMSKNMDGATHLPNDVTSMVNSGASFHCIASKFRTKKEKKSLRLLQFPIPMQTANGLTEAKYEVDVN